MKRPANLLKVLLLLGSGLLLQICIGCLGDARSGAVGASLPTSEGGVASRAVCTQVMAGQRLNADEVARMVEVRSRFFGAGNVDARTGAVRADRFIATWVDVTGYAVAMQGHVLLWDAFIGDTSGYVPTNDCELSDLRPEFIFVGHGHFDHAQLVPTILNRNRSTVVIGSGELCSDVVAATSSLFTPNCIVAIPLGADQATRSELNGIIPSIAITALKHPHSDAAAPEDLSNPSLILPVPLVTKLPGQGPCLEASAGGAAVGCPALTSPGSLTPSYVQDGKVSVLYQFRFGNNFAVTWNNTNGPNLVGDAVLTAMAGLPQTDLEFGSILGFNGITNGFLDARHIAEALRTRMLIPGHHDFLPGVAGETFEPSLRAEFNKMPQATRPGIQFMADPGDYVNPTRMIWNPSSKIWSQPGPVAESQGR